MHTAKIEFFIPKIDQYTQCNVYEASCGAQSVEVVQSFANQKEKEKEKDNFEEQKAETLVAGTYITQKIFSC